MRTATIIALTILSGCGGGPDPADGSVGDGSVGRDAPDTDGQAPLDAPAGTDGGGRDASLPPPGDIGSWTDAPGACPGGVMRVDITTSEELADAARGEGARASDPPSTCYFIHDGSYESTENVLVWVQVGGDAGAPRRFVGESRAGVRIRHRGTVEADHVVIENLTFDLGGYTHSGAFNTLTIIGSSDVLVSHVDFTGDCVTGLRGGHVEVEESDGVVVESCLIERFGQCTGDGHLDHGVYLASGTSITVRNNVIRENSSRGVQLNTEGGSFGTIDGVTIERNRIYANGHRDYEDGIVVNGADTGTIGNLTVVRNLIYDNYYAGIRFVGDAQHDIAVELNTFHGNGASAGGSASEVNLDDSGSGAGTIVRRNIFSVGVDVLNDCYNAASRGFSFDDNLTDDAATPLPCVTNAVVSDPAFVDAAAGDFHTTNSEAAAYGAYAP